MADIPLFSGASAFRDTSPRARIPIESLSQTVNTALNVAQATPSVATSIARGITGGIEAYQTVRGNEAKINLAEAQAEKLRREAEQGGSPQEQLAALRLQQELEARQKQEDLMSIMQAGDNQQKIDALIGGQYTDIFATNPRFENQLARQVALDPSTPNAIRETYLNQKNRSAAVAIAERNKIALTSKYNDSISKLQSSSFVADVLGREPETNIVDVVKNVRFEPSGRFQIENGQIGKAQESFEMTGPPQSYVAIDRRTNKVISDFVLPEDKKLVDLTRGLSNQVGGEFSNTPTEQIVEKTSQIDNNNISQTSPSSFANTPPVERVLNTAPQNLQKELKENITTQPVNLGKYKQAVSNIPLRNQDGTFSLTNSEVLPILTVKGLGGDNETALAFKPQMETILSFMEEDIKGNSNSPEVAKQKIKEAVDAKRQVINGVLSQQYQTLKKNNLTGVSEKDVKAHNDKVRRTLKDVSSFAKGNVLSLQSSFDVGQLVEVTTPEELYNLRNYNGASSRMDLMLGELKRVAQQQAVADLKKGDVATSVRNITRAYK